MKTKTLLTTLLVLSTALIDIECLTNQDFFDLVKDHLQDLETVDPDDVSDVSDDDVIQLPGNGNDELDVPYLLSKIELLDSLQDLKEEKVPARRRTRRVGWFRIIHGVIRHVIRWFHRRRQQVARRSKSLGVCHLYLDHEYRINLEPEPMKFRLPACLKFSLSPGPDDQIALSVTNNMKPMFKKQISLSDSTKSCVPVAKLGEFADACIETYQPDSVKDDSCVRLISNIALKTKKYRVHLDLWCGDIPESIDDTDIKGLLENVQAFVMNDRTGDLEDIPMYDLPILYRDLQDGQGVDDRESQEFTIEE